MHESIGEYRTRGEEANDYSDEHVKRVYNPRYAHSIARALLFYNQINRGKFIDAHAATRLEVRGVRDGAWRNIFGFKRDSPPPPDS